MMSNEATDKALIEAAKKAAAEKATKWQGVGNEPYIGVDDWKKGGLKKGDRIAQFDWRDADKIMEGKASASQFFVKVEEGEKFDNLRDEATGQIDARKYGESVQVAPRLNADVNKDGVKGEDYGKHVYNDKLVEYEVLKDLPTAKSDVEHNKILGPGGGKQHMAAGITKEDLIKEGYIKPVKINEMVNAKEHRVDALKEVEKDLKRDGVKIEQQNDSRSVARAMRKSREKHVHQEHNVMKEKLINKGPEGIKEVAKMEKLEAKSAKLNNRELPKQLLVAKKAPVNKAPSKSASIER